jgi:acyl-coenzyme A thioesterase PaaI-like protein
MPMGKWLFSRAVCWKAPYFASISPRFEELRPRFARVSMRKRRAVQNHIGTVHAIAMCNLAELAAGTVAEVSIPRAMRWLPKGMQVEYLKKAEMDVEAVATMPPVEEGPAREVPVTVELNDRTGVLVCRAVIAMWVAPRK